MNKYFTGIAIMTTGIFISNLNAQDYGAQIDALQNEVLKMKQKINQSSKEDKAYFVKGKGLSIKSTDGKYSFQIKGRLMYDMAAIVHDEKTVNGVTSDYNSSPLGDSEGWGSEFRKISYNQGEIGNGWGLPFNQILLIHQIWALIGQLFLKMLISIRKLKVLVKYLLVIIKLPGVCTKIQVQMQ